jgi:CRP-like cAMP-binding protein
VVLSVFGWLRETMGERAARALAMRFNHYALAAGWHVGIAEGHVEDTLASEAGLMEQGRVYSAALTLFLDLAAAEAGEAWTKRALQRAYDGLRWEEREIGAQYLFRDVKRAEALSHEFRSVTEGHLSLLGRMPLFATMDNAELRLLVSRMRPERYAPGQIIIRQGEPGDKFYVIERGHVDVIVRDERGVSEVANRLGRGDFFGELALLRDTPRTATCRATVPTHLLSLSRQDFDHLVKSRFALREKLGESISRAELLRRLPLFAELDAQQIQLLASRLSRETYASGDVIMCQGEVGEAFYVVESGRVQISVDQDGRKRVIAERGPGEYVGEIALLLDVPRTATATALTAVSALSLDRKDFDRLVAEHLFVSQGLDRESSRRMIDLNRTGTLLT